MIRIRGRAAIALAISCAFMACKDSTGPGEGRPGRALLDSRQFSEFTWLPSGDEILFATPFDYPYTGPPTRLEVIAVPQGRRRTVATAPSPGDQIVPTWFTAQGSHAYFHVTRAATGMMALYRAPLGGGGAPQLIVDSAVFALSVSPDERTIAWISSGGTGAGWSLVATSIATGTRRSYPLEHRGEEAIWSPSGRTILVLARNSLLESGTPFQLIDVESGATRVWLAPREAGSFPSRSDIGWQGEIPYLHAASSNALVRYSIVTGASQLLATGTIPGSLVGWTAAFDAAIFAEASCLEWFSGPFGTGCRQWMTVVERLAIPSGERVEVFRIEGTQQVDVRASPNGEWLAYAYGGCVGGCHAPGDGLYVVRMP